MGPLGLRDAARHKSRGGVIQILERHFFRGNEAAPNEYLVACDRTGRNSPIPTV